MKKIYEQDSYRREHDALVTSCSREGEDTFIQLDESVFFPEEGGQYADTGRLLTADGSSIRLLDGRIVRGEVFYRVEKEIPAGTSVHCELDWEQRRSRMQQHTGEHILTGTIHNRYGYNNVGFHLSDDAPVTLDLDGPLTWEQAMEMEAAANEAVTANLPVVVLYPSREELAGLEYRSKIEIEGQVRLVAIGEGENRIDLCACCAPHVARTGEVGLIKIVSLQNYKGGVRIGILCGARAMEHYRREWKRSLDLAKSLSTGVEQVPEAVEALREELALARQELAAQREAALLRELDSIPEDGLPLLFAEASLPPAVMKNVYNALTSRFPGYAGIFAGDDEQGWRYYAGSVNLDSRELAAGMRSALGAKGGGSREMVQGKTDAARSRIEAFWREIRV